MVVPPTRFVPPTCSMVTVLLLPTCSIYTSFGPVAVWAKPSTGPNNIVAKTMLFNLCIRFLFILQITIGYIFPMCLLGIALYFASLDCFINSSLDSLISVAGVAWLPPLPSRLPDWSGVAAVAAGVAGVSAACG